jgi:hypothetical protein
VVQSFPNELEPTIEHLVPMRKSSASMAGLSVETLMHKSIGHK